VDIIPLSKKYRSKEEGRRKTQEFLKRSPFKSQLDASIKEKLSQTVDLIVGVTCAVNQNRGTPARRGFPFMIHKLLSYHLK
jgi:hypothetical protein